MLKLEIKTTNAAFGGLLDVNGNIVGKFEITED